jgi:hypothetical protein
MLLPGEQVHEQQPAPVGRRSDGRLPAAAAEGFD